MCRQMTMILIMTGDVQGVFRSGCYLGCGRGSMRIRGPGARSRSSSGWVMCRGGTESWVFDPQRTGSLENSKGTRVSWKFPPSLRCCGAQHLKDGRNLTLKIRSYVTWFLADFVLNFICSSSHYKVNASEAAGCTFHMWRTWAGAGPGRV